MHCVILYIQLYSITTVGQGPVFFLIGLLTFGDTAELVLSFLLVLVSTLKLSALSLNPCTLWYYVFPGIFFQMC